jgi:Leucine-rich repeat (LRR) protein
MRSFCYGVLLLLVGLIVFPVQAQDSDAEYQRVLEKIEEARQTHDDHFILNLPNIPPELFSLTDLKFLMISGVGLTDLPPEIVQLKNLETLALARNRLTSLPDEISQLKNLKLLLLSGNGIQELPPSLWTMTSLEELWLDYNQFTTLPPEIGQLTNLTILNVGGNRLTSLPSEIEYLTQLCWLDANSNRLTELPPAVTRVQSLAQGEGCRTKFGGSIKEGLQVWGNPLPYPGEVINGDTRAIFAYLDNQAAYYVQRAVLVAGGVGSLIVLVGAGVVWRVRRRGEKKKKRG